MAKSSPEGIELGKGSTLIKMEVSVGEEQYTGGLEMGQIPSKEGGKINPLLMDEIGQFKFLPKQETTSEGFHRISKEFDYSEFDFVSFKIGTEWQQEQFSKSEFIQLVRATKSDAEVRRIIREYFK